MEQNHHLSENPVQKPGMQLSPLPKPDNGMLPGAIQNPCCMGTEAMEMLGVLTGFIEDELADRRMFLALQQKAPNWAKRELGQLADNAGSHAGQLMSACYLIKGQCYRPAGFSVPVYTDSWCRALRQCYHSEACNALNYARAADGTTDVCLRNLLRQLSQEEYHHTEVLMELVRRSMCC